MPKYYGPNEVERMVPLGEKYTELVFKDGKKAVISQQMEQEALTDEPIDLTALRDKRIKPVAKAVLGVMLDWNLKVSEIEFLFTLVATSFNENMKAATDKVWGVSELERSVLDVDNVLRKA
jgi:hypothetical protein